MGKLTTGVVLAAMAAVGWFAFQKGVEYGMNGGLASTKTELKPVNITALEKKLSQVSELATVSYSYTDVATHEKNETVSFFGKKINYSTSTIHLQYSGVIKAGIDLSKAKFDIKDTLVTFLLPQSQILSHDIDQSSLKILNLENGYFSSIKIEDFNKFCVEHRDSMEAIALRSGLLKEAQEKSIESLSLITDPLASDGYTVVIRNLADSTEIKAVEAPQPLTMTVEAE